MGFERLLVTLAIAALSAITGCKGDSAHRSADAGASGTVAVTADEKGFSPSSVSFKQGEPASLLFTRTTDETCATEVVFPELDVKRDLPKGVGVRVDIPTDKPRKLTFQCGMGMYKSSVVVH